MGWNGSGVFTRESINQSGPETWKNSKAGGRKIRTDDHDHHDEDIAQGLENCVTRDGQNSPSANLPMNDKRHTNVANAANDDEYSAWGQTKTRISTDVSAAETRITAAFAPSVGSLDDGASIAWDVDDNPAATVTLGGNRTLANPTNAEAGGVYILAVQQDGTGSRTLAYGNAYDFGEEGEPALSAAASTTDILIFFYLSSKMRLVGISKGFTG